MNYTKLDTHIYHASGKAKTVCVTACLTALGVPVNSFNYTGTVTSNHREAILRRHGFAVRSRKSALPKNPTIGKVRETIKKKMKDPNGTKYLVIVHGSNYCHAMLLDSEGKTVVDTWPKKRDRRKVVKIHAVFKK